ncbi:MAG: Crp/Fnr family transcriptional regulator [Hyphomicrobiales bacterium]|nr:MAG: Crp/Fnr family transcriptional regulator [Hyphomicrobiales bacterium]
MNKITVSQAWSGTADCQSCTLRAGALFAGLTEPDFRTIHTPITQNSFKPGAMIFQAGGTQAHMFTIRKGLVKLVTYLPDGTMRIVRLLKATDVCGLETLLGEPYHHDAIALVETEVCRFPARLVKQLSMENRRLYDDLMRRWQSALTTADMWVAEFSTGSARQRVARLFLQLAKDNGPEHIQLFSREDVGAVLGVTTETASRTIAEFKRQGLIAEDKPNAFRCDAAQLSDLANG